MTESYSYNSADKRSVNGLVTRVFGRMFTLLLVTAVIAIGAGILFTYGIYGGLDRTATPNLDWVNALRVIVVITAIALIIMTFVVSLVLLKGNHSIAAPAYVYSALMGILLSELVVFLPWEILGTAFLITCLVFGLMSLIGLLSKGNLSILGMVGSGIISGALMIWGIGLLISLFNPSFASSLYYIVSFATFAGVMLITIFDIWNIKQIAESGEMSKNLILYCAFRLYTDFIYIFIRIVYFLMIVYARNR